MNFFTNAKYNILTISLGLLLSMSMSSANSTRHLHRRQNQPQQLQNNDMNAQHPQPHQNQHPDPQQQQQPNQDIQDHNQQTSPQQQNNEQNQSQGLPQMQASQCERVVTRPEIRELSTEQRQRFINGVRKLTEGGAGSEFMKLSQIHLNANEEAHGVPAFLPWHREFIRTFELALQRIDPEIILPYWDWSIDSQSPENSIVLSEEFFGGNGIGNDRCVGSGPMKGYQVTIPDEHCLRRDFDGGNKIGAFYSAEALEYVLQQPDYYSFERKLEAAPHARIHIGIGGSYGDIMTMYSANDPIFYLHHTFIDKLWYEWQMRNPQAVQYAGNNLQGQAVSSGDTLGSFGLPIKETFSTLGSRYCYNYKRYGSGQSGSQQQQPNIQRRALLGGLLDNLPIAKNIDNISNIKNMNVLKDLNKNNGLSKLIGNIAKPLAKIVSSLTKELEQIKFDAFDRTLTGILREPAIIPESHAKMNHIPYEEVLEYQLEIKNAVIDAYNSNNSPIESNSTLTNNTQNLNDYKTGEYDQNQMQALPQGSYSNEQYSLDTQEQEPSVQPLDVQQQQQPQGYISQDQLPLQDATMMPQVGQGAYGY